MTDNDIIKALECCLDENRESCTGCKFFKVTKGCNVRKHCYNLINRQKAEICELQHRIDELNVELVGMRGACESYKIHYDAEVEKNKLLQNTKQLNEKEIERLRKENEGYSHLEVILHTAIDKLSAQIKSEAFNKFAERLKNIALTGIDHEDERVKYIMIKEEWVDNLVKEMEGDTDE